MHPTHTHTHTHAHTKSRMPSPLQGKKKPDAGLLCNLLRAFPEPHIHTLTHTHTHTQPHTYTQNPELLQNHVMLHMASSVAITGGASGKEPACQCRRCKRCGFYPWVGKIPWRRAWQPTSIFLPGKFHGQRDLAGYIYSMGLQKS